MSGSCSAEMTDDAFEGYSISPKTNCPHIASSSFTIDNRLLSTSSQQTDSHGKQAAESLYAQHLKCEDCADASETWVCLRCTRSGCGRYLQAHMAIHAAEQLQMQGACAPVIALGLADLSTWCFVCDSYITHPKLEGVFAEMHFAKFGYSPSAALHAGDSQQGPITIELGHDHEHGGSAE